MAVLSVHHVSLVVADTQKSIEFYNKVLGIPLSEDRPELGFPGAWLQLGGQQIHLLEVPNPDPVSGRPEHGGRDRHVAFSVDDLATYEALLQQHQLAYSKSLSGRRALFCRDPDGNGVELIERV